MRHLFIINPAAGRPESTARLETLLSRLSFPHEVAIPGRPGTPNGWRRRRSGRGAGAHLRLRRGRHPQRGGQRGGGL